MKPPFIRIEVYGDDDGYGTSQIDYLGATLYIEETEYGFCLQRTEYAIGDLSKLDIEEFVQLWTWRAQKLNLPIDLADDVVELTAELEA